MFLSLLGMVISVVGLLCIKYYYTKSFAWQGVYLPTSYSTSAVLMLSICFFIFCQGINLNDKAYKCISILGKNTMGIYYMHILMIILLQKYLFPMFKFEYGVCYNLLKTVLAICLSLIVTLVIKKIPLIRKIVI